MQASVPFQVVYQTEDPVPIEQVIQSLQAVQHILNDSSALLPSFITGLTVERISIQVKQIEEGSLREIFGVALFMAFQEDLETEIPALIETLTGQPVPEHLETLVTITTLIVLYYGIIKIIDVLGDRFKRQEMQVQYDGLVDDVAKLTGKPREEIIKALESQYEKRGKLSQLGRSALKFFTPSKSQKNAPILINDRVIKNEVVAEVPDKYLAEEEMSSDVYQDYDAVNLEIHAQDRDKRKTGWAAVVEELGADRLKVKLVEEVRTDQVWQKDSIVADVSVRFERDGDKLVPKEVMVRKVHD